MASENVRNAGRCRRYTYTGSRTEDGNRRWGTASASTPAAALVTLFFITDEELCADYRPDSHNSGTCNPNSVPSFGKILRVAAGAKINSRRCENIGGSTIFGVPRQGHLNNGPICDQSSVLRKIRDLHEMIARHRDFENRIVAWR